MIADTTCQRIEWLIHHHLRKLANSRDGGGWETLYKDPDDGRYWESDEQARNSGLASCNKTTIQ